MPGSGKSAAAQALTRELLVAGIAARWSYEEEVDHPVSGFGDLSAARAVVEQVQTGNFDAAVGSALARWAGFAQAMANASHLAVADGCLLGYMTWTLFWGDAPRALIAGYVRSAAEVLEPLRPIVFHLRPADVRASWEDLRHRRGDEWLSAAITQVTERSRWGRRMGFAGFDGLIAYWERFAELARWLLDGLPLQLHEVAVDPSNREGAEALVLRLMGLSQHPRPEPPPLRALIGTYHDSQGRSVDVRIGERGIVADGLSGAWPVVDLLPAEPDSFDVRGMPWKLVFELEQGVSATACRVEGPALLDAPPPGPYRRSG